MTRVRVKFTDVENRTTHNELDPPIKIRTKPRLCWHCVNQRRAWIASVSQNIVKEKEKRERNGE